MAGCGGCPSISASCESSGFAVERGEDVAEGVVECGDALLLEGSWSRLTPTAAVAAGRRARRAGPTARLGSMIGTTSRRVVLVRPRLDHAR